MAMTVEPSALPPAAASVLHTLPLVTLICRFQAGALDAIRTIKQWPSIDGLHGPLLVCPTLSTWPCQDVGAVNLSLDELPSIMETRRGVVKRLLARTDQTAALRDAMVQNSHVRTVVAEFAAFDGIPQLMQDACVGPANQNFRIHWYSTSQWRTPRSLFQLAAFHGHLSIWRALREMHYPKQYADGRAMAYAAIEVAATRGHVAFLGKMLHIRGRFKLRYLVSSPNDSNALGTVTRLPLLDVMCAKGTTSAVQLLLDAGSSHTTDAMDRAAANGHVDVVKILHELSNQGCTTTAMDQAAIHGHDKVVRFLHANRSEGCTVAAMDAYIGRGDVDMVHFLHSNRPEKCSTTALHEAIVRGHYLVVKYLVDHKVVTPTVTELEAAAAHGHLTIVKYLYNGRRGTTLCVATALRAAAKANHDDIVTYLDARRCSCCESILLETMVKKRRDQSKRKRQQLNLYVAIVSSNPYFGSISLTVESRKDISFGNWGVFVVELLNQEQLLTAKPVNVSKKDSLRKGNT
ncbi:Aste57867_9050 [Aphanomyces stellatus]|uniref:Aste57867_9050 protein n=1 Tax=Aphanomyces stellatus TaxID=120398 RepID=A0A485KM28_9STRA|nr:hypothetical protein As57867_009014 [Aphanomyces stellatus]VFT85934.1 Aste57867_9050 [Aphanomyces stellatus]